MPKESVFSRWHGTSDAPTPFVQVGWSRGRMMQIGILAGGDYNEHGSKGSSDEPAAPVVERPQMWVDLDRDGINYLIRQLRRARDEAFGADA